MKGKDAAYGGISIALLALCSWISIPMTVPFTMQTFAVYLICYLFAGKKAFIYILCYILCGAIGLPVFSNFQGGIAALTGLTGGYIWGFLWIALLFWLFQKKVSDSAAWFRIVGIVGLLLCYAFGTFWFLFVSQNTLSIASLISVCSICVIPFVLPDLAKMMLAQIVAGRIGKIQRKG